jgi:hypothetical protein
MRYIIQLNKHSLVKKDLLLLIFVFYFIFFNYTPKLLPFIYLD